MEVVVGLLLILALAASTLGQMPPMPMGQMPPMHMQPPHPHPMQAPPPPYNLYGPMSPQAASSNAAMMYPPPPQQLMAPPPGPSPYPAPTSVSYSTSMYPMMAAAGAPYPAYGMPPPMMYPPPYQTYSGAGPNGDPFSSSAGAGIFNAKALSQLFGLKKKR